MEKKKRKELLGIILKEVEKITPVVDQTFLADLISFKVEQFVDQELDRAREEGYQNCMDDIWEKARGLRSWTEHDGSVSAGDIEAGLREAYLEIEEELVKLNSKKK